MVVEGDSKAEVVYMDQNMVVEVVRKYDVVEVVVDLVEEEVGHSTQDMAVKVAAAVHNKSVEEEVVVVVVQKGPVEVEAVVEKALVLMGEGSGGGGPDGPGGGGAKGSGGGGPDGPDGPSGGGGGGAKGSGGGGGECL
ncbi:hypothetical protein CCACVL1_13069 [Corchorus capsularis]|uniref:Uncharacterized protein n=1 Tax=Corchorus capsularis TaxID=210143 RepID=A0A1R3ICK1_COCAP|nr:hypothetical protein CCACVL1_13069 [Corchorus capsularis]